MQSLNQSLKNRREFLGKFIERAVIVKYWSKGLESFIKAVEVRLIVQSEDVNTSWTGPKVKKEDLRKYNTSLVACGFVGSKREPHALYVETCLPIMNVSNKYCHEFTCINSWGQIKPTLKLKSVSDVYQIHYVSLFTVSQIVIASSGESAKTHCDVFGIYDQVINDEAVLFRQRHSASQEGQGNLLYKTKDGFAIGQIGSKPCLENNSVDSLFYVVRQTGDRCYVPLAKWQFFGRYILINQFLF